MKKQAATGLLTPVHYVVWRSEAGGAELSVNHYIERFSSSRAVHVFSLRASKNEIYDGSKIQFQNGADNDWDCYRAYFRYCRAHKDDLFHLMSVGPVILLLTLLAGVRQPVYHIHGTLYWKKPFKKLYLKTAWWLAGLFRVHFVANSHYSAGIFDRVVLPVSPKVIYNGFALGSFLAARTLRPELRRMAYAGRLQPGKNADLVIRLFDEIAADYPNLELHIAGDGALRPALERQAAQSAAHDRIKFRGWVDDIATFYGEVDLFVFLSAYESFGNVLPEALLTGLPVLTSNIPVFEEIYGADKTFVLGDPAQYPVLLENFRKAIAGYPELARRAFALSDRMAATFNIEHHLTEIENIYAQIESAGHLLPLRGAGAVRQLDSKIPDAAPADV